MAANSQPRITPEEYLERERAAEFRSEYYGGEVFAMSGGSWGHARVISNLVRRLGNALEKRCTVVSGDMRIEVSSTGMYTYPDVMVVCGEPRFIDNRTDTIVNPRVIIEVVSPSTERYDRGGKAQQYRTVESLQEYVLVSQYGPRIEIYRRHERGTWLLTEFIGVQGVCRFESLDCEIPLAQIYEEVKFEMQAYPLPNGG